MKPLTPGGQRYRDMLARQKAGRLEKGVGTMANDGKNIMDRLAERYAQNSKRQAAASEPKPAQQGGGPPPTGGSAVDRLAQNIQRRSPLSHEAITARAQTKTEKLQKAWGSSYEANMKLIEHYVKTWEEDD